MSIRKQRNSEVATSSSDKRGSLAKRIAKPLLYVALGAGITAGAGAGIGEVLLHADKVSISKENDKLRADIYEHAPELMHTNSPTDISKIQNKIHKDLAEINAGEQQISADSELVDLLADLGAGVGAIGGIIVASELETKKQQNV